MQLCHVLAHFPMFLAPDGDEERPVEVLRGSPPKKEVRNGLGVWAGWWLGRVGWGAWQTGRRSNPCPALSQISHAGDALGAIMS